MTATTLFFEQNEIVAGSDGMQVSGHDIDHPAICKIGTGGGLFFTIGGMADCDEVGYHAPALMGELLDGATGSTIAERTNAIERALAAACNEGRKFVELNEPHNLERFLDGKATLHIVVFGVINGSLGVSYRDIWEDHTKRLDVTQPRNPLLASPNPQTLPRFVAANGNDLNKVRSDPRGSSRRFLEMAAEDSPDMVGPPFHILSITPAGAEWVAKSKECFDL
jgi:hypothetical protein